MTAFTSLTEIHCDGPGWPNAGCPTDTVARGSGTSVEEMRRDLQGLGWQTVDIFDLGPDDRCPRCSNGTP